LFSMSYNPSFGRHLSRFLALLCHVLVRRYFSPEEVTFHKK
jgi:hypothetical protein